MKIIIKILIICENISFNNIYIYDKMKKIILDIGKKVLYVMRKETNMENVVSIEEVKNKRECEKFVYKEKGKGNKNFNAFCVKCVNTKRVSSKGRENDIVEILIAFRNKQGLEKVHSSLSFILDDIWNRYQPNAKYTRANHIVQFLNWTLINKKYLKNYNNLSDLTLEMFMEYLKACYHDYDHDTHKYVKKTLKPFYKAIRKHGIINEYLEDDFINTEFDKLPVSKFERNPMRHNLPRDLIKILVDVCEIEAEDILLGVMFGIVGGCRVGELVNLIRNSVRKVGIYDFKIDIKDRMLRPDVKSTRTRGTPKVPRSQKIYYSYIGIELFGEKKLKEVYEKHKINFKAIDGSNALFVNSDGKAMTAKNFKERFGKVKKSFIKNIEGSRNPVINAYAKKLKTDRWGVHILRGLFSWLYAEKIGNTAKGIKELQYARGDSSPESAMRYLADIDEMNRQQEKAIHETRQQNFKKKPLPVEKYRVDCDERGE